MSTELGRDYTKRSIRRSLERLKRDLREFSEGKIGKVCLEQLMEFEIRLIEQDLDRLVER